MVLPSAESQSSITVSVGLSGQERLCYRVAWIASLTSYKGVDPELYESLGQCSGNQMRVEMRPSMMTKSHGECLGTGECIAWLFKYLFYPNIILFKHRLTLSFKKHLVAK